MRASRQFPSAARPASTVAIGKQEPTEHARSVAIGKPKKLLEEYRAFLQGLTEQ